MQAETYITQQVNASEISRQARTWAALDDAGYGEIERPKTSDVGNVALFSANAFKNTNSSNKRSVSRKQCNISDNIPLETEFRGNRADMRRERTARCLRQFWFEAKQRMAPLLGDFKGWTVVYHVPPDRISAVVEALTKRLRRRRDPLPCIAWVRDTSVVYLIVYGPSGLDLPDIEGIEREPCLNEDPQRVTSRLFYRTKGHKLPKGARQFGVAQKGLTAMQRRVVRWSAKPEWLRRLAPPHDVLKRRKGGGWVSRMTKTVYRSPYEWRYRLTGNKYTSHFVRPSKPSWRKLTREHAEYRQRMPRYSLTRAAA